MNYSNIDINSLDFRNEKRILELRGDLLKEATELNEKASDGNADAAKAADRALAKIKALDRKAEAEGYDYVINFKRSVRDENPNIPFITDEDTSGKWLDSSGREIRVLKPKDRMARARDHGTISRFRYQPCHKSNDNRGLLQSPDRDQKYGPVGQCCYRTGSDKLNLSSTRRETLWYCRNLVFKLYRCSQAH